MSLLLVLDEGPCMGAYSVQLAPQTLHAVRSAFGKTDVLDLVEDTPRDDEDLFLYQRQPGTGHICGRGRGGGCVTTVNYRYVGPLDRETGEIAEVSDRDRDWWESQRLTALAAWADGERFAVHPPLAPAPEPLQGTLL